MNDNNTHISFKLNPKFYSEKAINATIVAFNDVCDGKVDSATSTILLQPKVKVDSKTLIYEFCNYCLSLMK